MNDIVVNDQGVKLRMSLVLLVTFLVALVGFALWAYVSPLDVITKAQGVIIPSSRVQSIQSLDGGVLTAIAVREGDIVEKGQVIVELDRVKNEAIYGESVARLASLEITAIRLQAEITEKPLKFPAHLVGRGSRMAAQLDLYEQRKAALSDDLAVLELSLALTKKELALNEPLLATGEVSEVDIIRLRRQVNEVKGTINQRRSKYINEAQVELAKVEDDLAAQREVAKGRKDALDHTRVLAPMRGVVKNVRVTTLGGVVRSAEEIMQIVPLDEELLVEIKINPIDVAFLKPGLPVSVKLDAYDYSIYGTLKGELIYLSPDSLREDSAKEDVKLYRGIVRTTGSKLRNPKAQRIEIIPGMTASAEITTGQRTVMQYLMKPLIKGLNEGLHER